MLKLVSLKFISLSLEIIITIIRLQILGKKEELNWRSILGWFRGIDRDGAIKNRLKNSTNGLKHGQLYKAAGKRRGGNWTSLLLLLVHCCVVVVSPRHCSRQLRNYRALCSWLQCTSFFCLPPRRAVCGRASVGGWGLAPIFLARGDWRRWCSW